MSDLFSAERKKKRRQQAMSDAKQPPYDFDFICRSLNLVPYQAFSLDDKTVFYGVFNAGAIVNLEFTENGKVAITLHGGEEILMNGDHLADLEETIKRRTKELQEIQAELRIQSELNAANQAMANAAMMGKLKGLKRNS